jgi:predicted enzyme related to lactoylglutathione lyase
VSTPRLGATVLDCDDPRELAEFWSGVLELPIVVQRDDWWELAPAPGGPSLAFQKVARHRPPNARRPQQLHLDIAVDDLDAAERRILDLGAVILGKVHPGDRPWRVYADPAGHPFCLCACATVNSRPD